MNRTWTARTRRCRECDCTPIITTIYPLGTPERDYYWYCSNPVCIHHNLQGDEAYAMYDDEQPLWAYTNENIRGEARDEALKGFSLAEFKRRDRADHFEYINLVAKLRVAEKTVFKNWTNMPIEQIQWILEHRK